MNVPAEINAVAVKNGPAEKVTPMMQHTCCDFSLSAT
jgi:hypothetical protein